MNINLCKCAKCGVTTNLDVHVCTADRKPNELEEKLWRMHQRSEKIKEEHPYPMERPRRSVRLED